MLFADIHFSLIFLTLLDDSDRMHSLLARCFSVCSALVLIAYCSTNTYPVMRHAS